MRSTRWIVIAGLLAVTACSTSTVTQSAPDTPACVPTDEISALLRDTQDELTAAGASATAFDLAASAEHTDSASDNMQQVADLTADYPEMSNDAEMAANYMSDAADQLRGGDITAATASMDQTIVYINQATDDATALLGVAVAC